MVGPQHDMPNQTSDFRLYTHSWPVLVLGPGPQGIPGRPWYSSGWGSGMGGAGGGGGGGVRTRPGASPTGNSWSRPAPLYVGARPVGAPAFVRGGVRCVAGVRVFRWVARTRPGARTTREFLGVPGTPPAWALGPGGAGGGGGGRPYSSWGLAHRRFLDAPCSPCTPVRGLCGVPVLVPGPGPQGIPGHMSPCSTWLRSTRDPPGRTSLLWVRQRVPSAWLRCDIGGGAGACAVGLWLPHFCLC